MGATLNVAKPNKGSTVAIFGLGGVGLAVSSKNKCSLPFCSCVYTEVQKLQFC